MFLLLWLFLFSEPQKRIQESPPLTSTAQATRYWFPVGQCDRSSPVLNWNIPLTSGAVPICTRIGAGLEFPDNNTYSAHKTILLPDGFISGTSQFRLFWTAPSVEGNVRWKFDARCYGHGDNEAFAVTSGGNYVESLSFAPANSLRSGVIVAIGSLNCTPGNLMTITMIREGQHASDTADVSVTVLGLELVIQ